jgi:hypothetical protein
MPWWESEQQVKEKKAKEQAKKARRWGDPDKGSGGRGQDYFQRQAEANRRERERREAAEAAAQRRAEQDYWEGEKARNDAQRQRQQEAAAAAAEMQKFQRSVLLDLPPLNKLPVAVRWADHRAVRQKRKKMSRSFKKR